jgi:hypothetical protein
VQLRIDDRARWTGPARLPASLDDALPSPSPSTDAIAALLSAAQAPDDVRRVHARIAGAFATLAAESGGRHRLPLVRAALVDPATLEQWLDRWYRAGVADPVRSADALTPVLCETLALSCVTAPPAAPVDGLTWTRRLAALVARLDEILPRALRAALEPDVRRLVEVTASGRVIHAQPEAVRLIGAMQASLAIDRAAQLAVLADLLALARDPPAALPSMPPPAALSAQVEGEISAWAPLGDGYLVIGGDGPNRYQMRTLYAVLDPGGDDVYTWDAGVPPVLQLIVDTGGADRYEASYGGPGAGWLGVGLLIDLEGDDQYRSVFGGCGAGVFGFGVLIDRTGSDRYRCDAWASGAGLYGGGALFDFDDDADTYLAQFASQGVGGPHGVGLLIDGGGDDLYRANGLVDSVYATPAVFAGFSQGVGYGLRPHDHGGVGLLLDGGGNDRYEGGEFSQGGGYFWGAGVLADSGGDDLYYGNRYAQGFAAHQAVGLLLDAQGDDAYWSMTAAAQGAAWDQSVAILRDLGGDDHYRAGALSQGAAAHQSRAALHDFGGDDRYWSRAASVQGAAGANDYHLVPDDPVYSLGLLLDLGGDDRYSRDLAPGAMRTDLPAAGTDGAGVAGVASDRD